MTSVDSWKAPDLRGRVALVTGASRGVGKGIALALGSAGARVFITARSYDGPQGALPGSLAETAAEIEKRGGIAVPMACDHKIDADAARVADAIESEIGRLDILVNNVFAVPSGAPLFGAAFWNQPIDFWDTMIDVGARSHYVMSVLTAPLLLRSEAGLIANISSFGGATYQLNVAYGVGKAAVDRLSRDMAHDLRPHNVASVSLYPGIVRTERVLSDKSLPFSMDNTESAEFTGRAIAQLAIASNRMAKTGKTLVVAELAAEYGFCDIDGRKPASLRKTSPS